GGVRWEDARKFHCTLRFLGSVEQERLDSIEEQVRSAASLTRPLSLRYAGIGFFPDSAHPRIVWVGITDEAGGLSQLQQRISGGLSRLGFAAEARPFHPHVTLGRVGTSHRPERLTDIMKTCTFEHPPVIVPAVEIMQSVTSPHGSEYLLLRSIPL
ncbi:MAG TPA: RNA 2',3'-cyclic phosphodiesterase, partial [Bacteroidota bacterium]|nr:RNA 2',3'-cyclic phosphodiesterase [Bacteroidota bacterium]